MKEQTYNFNYKNFDLEVSCFVRPGGSSTLLFLHGLGCAKNDFYGATQNQYLKEMTLIGIDFPGCGNSSYPEKARFGIDDLVNITDLVLDKLNPGKIVVLGHSMGGLVGLLFTEKFPAKVTAFINVEGNLAGSDCFFSRKVAGMERGEFINHAFEKYIFRVKINQNKGLQEHAKILKKYASAAAMRDVCPTLVSYSEEEDVLKRFLDLRMPVQFIYGSQNNKLPYLPALKNSHCKIDEISSSGHFPFYENPDLFYEVIAKFIKMK
ncbi:MAG: alpha/beta hydrolase [Calditrichaeota bacterium]|nr:MAG: alpha/beta hydrolase [Calditrichota bacterium]MBL1206013.1 alpha/beta hydrolase [Calditrichota bacterium]NOG45841.1 alpha/beta hydrolase [Calditrichota bacterium]